MRNRRQLIAAVCVLAWLPALCWGQTHQPAEPESPAAQTAEHGAPAESAAHGEATHGGDGHGDKPALLQFDPGAAIWTIIVFITLLIVLRLAAWKPILRVLTAREEFIEKSIANAKAEREEAEKLLGEYKAQLDKARLEATAIVEEGRRDAGVLGRRIQEEARQEAEEIAARARREIELARDTAIKELYDKTAELAVHVAAGIIRKELSPEDHRGFVADSLKRMEESGDAQLN